MGCLTIRLFEKIYAAILLIITPLMSYSQLNENILFKTIDEVKNIDFKKLDSTDHTDYSIDIEYYSDYYYQPQNLEPYTFLDYPISCASFYMTQDEHIKSFGMYLQIENATEFYKKMVENYGKPLIVNHSKHFFQQHGVELPKIYTDEAIKLLESIPFPIIQEYKDMTKLNWYMKHDNSSKKEVVISIYNMLNTGDDFFSLRRNLRLIIKEIQE